MTAEAQNIVTRYVQQRVLLVSLGFLALLFVVTAAMARAYHAREEGLAAEWSQKANVALAAGRPGEAFEDFRNSLSYGPEDATIQLQLAEALGAGGRFTEARSYLVNLWDRTPGSGQVNLDLAHVSNEMGDVDDAIRYFHGAIFGIWEKDPELQRRKVRLELCEFLLTQDRSREAQAEIAGLAADTPPDDPILRAENGHLFLKAGEPGRALAEFEAALKINPRQSQWLADAGQVAFQDGDYLKAETYFSHSDRENPSDEIHASLVLVRDVLGNDPFMAGLSDEEQARRTLGNFKQGRERLRACAGAGTNSSASGGAPGDLQRLDQEAADLEKRIRLSSLGNNLELRADAMHFVSEVEDATARNCGAGSTLDQALKLIEKRHEVNNQ